MLIKFDNREAELYKYAQQLIETIPSFKNLKTEFINLPLGDVIISTDNNSSLDKSNIDKIIIERKSISDLISSIKDGRYEEQSYRLNGLEDFHNHNIIYLIEGDINRTCKFNRFKDNGSEKMMCYSSMFSLNYYKGFSVLRSFNLEETAFMICNIAYKLGKDITKKPFYNNLKQNQTGGKIIDVKVSDNNELNNDNSNNEVNNNIIENCNNNVIVEEACENNYVSVIKKVKKDNITVNNIDAIMLCQIPGISSVTSTAIISKFNSLSNLIKELELNEDCLKDVSTTNEKGQTRKISKTCIANIVKFLLKK